MKLLLVEDDRIVRITVRDALEEAGFDVVDCDDGSSAMRAIESKSFDLVLTDIRLPGHTGLEIFRQARRLQPDAAVILMTAYADTNDAVAVMREGALDYITKPFEIDELLLRVSRIQSQIDFRKRMEAGGSDSQGQQHRSIRGTSPAMKRLLERIEAAAATDVSVLISGETGSGKDLCARTIHERSRRASKPFVAVNCGAIPENLFEAELFGHEKGAFTGADRKRIGRFEAANGGTLFLDEVGELPLGSQVKLLRALDTSTFEAVGSSRTLSVDVRIIAATNVNLPAAIDAGAFRKDLFYRLNVIDLHTPPLRERRVDLPMLVQEFLSEICARQGCAVAAFEPAAIAAIATHDYPGNVRELIHALERAVALSRGDTIRLEHLPQEIARSAGGEYDVSTPIPGGQLESLDNATEQFEQQYIRRVLEKVGGHRGHAAEALGISRKSLWQRLRDIK